MSKLIELNPSKAYYEAFGTEWADGLRRLIPGYMQEHVVRWVLLGYVDTDDFLYSVLIGDLNETFQRADDTNIDLVKNYVMFFHNYAPANCRGSRSVVVDWAKARQIEPLA